MVQQIESQITDIRRLIFHPWPTRPSKVGRVANVRGVIVGVTANGRVYTTQSSRWCYWTTTNRLASTVEGLVKLGMLSAEALKQHNEADAAERAAQNRRWAAEAVLESYERAGLKLTEKQLAHLMDAKAVA